ncbi:MAG: hypothetical protein LBV52_04130 [Spirochaetaceae bacterium]|jgi:hypothetical protein|nr:hypothetical protein [Spirochaetaceae bacterium]
MKKLIFVFGLVCLSSAVFAQQILWTTVDGAGEKVLKMKDVTNEVMKYYDQYDYYYDMTGFDKDTFVETFGGDGSWDWVYDVNTSIVSAIRVNLDMSSSAVYVVCVGSSGVNLVAFTDAYEDGAVATSSNRKDKFKKWFYGLME